MVLELLIRVRANQREVKFSLTRGLSEIEWGGFNKIHGVKKRMCVVFSSAWGSCVCAGKGLKNVLKFFGVLSCATNDWKRSFFYVF